MKLPVANTPARKVVLACAIILAPGGFILGATLVAKHIHQRKQARSSDEQASQK
jgi:hypothetical protein